MTRHRPALGLLLVTIVCACPVTAGEDDEIFKCTDAAGNVTFQDDPCPKVDVAPQKASEVKPPPAPPRPAPAPSPAPRAAPSRTGPPLVPAPVVVPPLPPRAVPQRATGVVQPVDPRYASPERTWQTFVAAMRDGDRAAALACLTPAAAEELGPLIDSTVPPEEVESDGQVGPFWALRAKRETGPPKWIFLERTHRGEWKIAAI